MNTITRSNISKVTAALAAPFMVSATTALRGSKKPEQKTALAAWPAAMETYHLADILLAIEDSTTCADVTNSDHWTFNNSTAITYTCQDVVTFEASDDLGRVVRVTAQEPERNPFEILAVHVPVDSSDVISNLLDGWTQKVADYDNAYKAMYQLIFGTPFS